MSGLKMTWPELLGYLEKRRAELDAYEKNLEMVRGVMEPNPGMTLEQALKRLGWTADKIGSLVEVR